MGAISEEEKLNPYAMLIANEARRRNIAVDILDAEGGFFKMTFAGRSVVCRESLSELTSAIALSICDDKRVTRRVAERAGVPTAPICQGASHEERAAFLSKHGSVVVKPARGEQGRGVAVGITTVEHMNRAIERAAAICPDVIVESCIEGVDIRLVVINGEVVAAALRRPPKIVGNGSSTVRQLIEDLSARRSAATGGESTVPLDSETKRCVELSGYKFPDVVPPNVEILVRRTANLHTGGTIQDVTSITHPVLIETAEVLASSIGISVVGIDLIIKSPEQPECTFIEANERPGLANHDPQPTAQRFVDMLFPESRLSTTSASSAFQEASGKSHWPSRVMAMGTVSYRS